jgi:NADP-reducing hydrogenase subunit HndB
MPTVKSLEDLKRIREEALQKRNIKEQSHRVEIIVGMGTPGIAAGARETMKAILQFIEDHQIADITVRQTGNIGLDSFEPIVQIQVQGQPKVTYGKITAEKVPDLLRQHILEGQVVQQYVISD